MYLGDVTIEYHDHAIPLHFVQSGINRQPLQTVVLPLPSTPIAESASFALPIGAPPAGTTHAVISFEVADAAHVGQPSATTDLVYVPLATTAAVPALDGTSRAWMVLLLAALSVFALRRTSSVA